MRASVAVQVVLVVSVGLAASCSTPPGPGAPTTTKPAAPSTTTSAPSTSTTSPTTTSNGGLPDQLAPNVVEDECLLTPAQFGSLVGQSITRAENTELADDAGRRSCFYGSSAEETVGRIDVYAPTAAQARDLVARIAANSSGSRTLPGVGDGAVVVPGKDGSFELVVASRALLVVLTLPPGAGAGVPPSDAAWSSAGTAMLARLPS